MSSQRIGKYACLEIERKYLLSCLPVDLNEQDPHWQITDHYLVQTRLRLRRMAQPATNQVLYKLGQKYRTDEQDSSQSTMTNLYLTKEEYQQLALLPARQLEKRRYAYLHQGHRYAIDIFAGYLTGLILAEIECETMAELAQLPVPAFAVEDVTADTFFSGGSLVAINRAAFQAGLAGYLQ
jgi:CYTH domain-containing protein